MNHRYIIGSRYVEYYINEESFSKVVWEQKSKLILELMECPKYKHFPSSELH